MGTLRMGSQGHPKKAGEVHARENGKPQGKQNPFSTRTPGYRRTDACGQGGTAAEQGVQAKGHTMAECSQPHPWPLAVAQSVGGGKPRTEHEDQAQGSPLSGQEQAPPEM
jgi:hypothetical protein